MWIYTFDGEIAKSLPTEWKVKASCSLNWCKWFVDRNDIAWVNRQRCIDVLNLSKFKYDLIGRYNEKGAARVRVWKKWGIVNWKWELLTPIIYDDVREDYEWDLFVCYRKGVWDVLIDSEWKIITKESYKYVWSTCELEKYWIAGCVSKEKWGKKWLVDFDGNLIWKWYDFVDCEMNDYWLITVEDNNLWGAMNEDGKEVIPPTFHQRNDGYKIENFGNYKIVRCMDKMGLIIDDKCVVRLWDLKNVYNYWEYFEVSHDWKNYLFDRELKLKTSGYDSLEQWVAGESWKVRRNGKVWLYNSEFEALIPCEYVDLRCLKYWMVILEKDNRKFSLFDLRTKQEINVEDRGFNEEFEHLPKLVNLLNLIFRDK